MVVGLPLRLDGSEGEASRRARNSPQQLGALTQLAIVMWDERLTHAGGGARACARPACAAGKRRQPSTAWLPR